MKGYGAMAGRYLKQQRRRTVLTIVGIILSVALICALGTMGQAVKDNLITNTKYEQGSYHFSYPEAADGLYDTLRKNVLVDQVAWVHYGGAATALQDDQMVTLMETNKDSFGMLPIHLQEGRWPQSSHEIIVEEWLLPRLPGKPALEAATELTGSDGTTQSYKVVGILKNQRYSQVGGDASIFTVEEHPQSVFGGEIQLFVTLKPGVDISDNLEKFSKLGDKFETNNQLLALIGESPDNGLNIALLVIFGTLIGLVVLSTIAVIYNAFHIAVLERIRQFGLLRTLGATPRQIRNLVFREATTLALVGIPLGLLVGWAGLWLALWLMMQGGMTIMQMEDFQLTFHWWIMALSIGVGIFAVYLAAWLPARKASRVSPVEAVKGAGSIVRESYRRARIPSLLHLLGVEGKMASHNIRRNRSKFRVTTFSIAVSITLFIVFHYFTQQSLQITVDTTENNKIGFELHRYVRLSDENGKRLNKEIPDIVTQEQLDQIAALPGVDEVYGHYSFPSASAWFPKDKINPEFVRNTEAHLPELNWQDTLVQSVFSNLVLYDDARLRKAAKYLTEGTVDPKKLAAEDGVLIIQTVQPYIKDSRKKERIELSHLKVGDMLTLQMGDENDEKSVRQVKVAGILSQSPFNAPYQTNFLTVIGTKTTFAKLLEAVPPDWRDMGTTLSRVHIAIEDGADTSAIKEALEQVVADIPGGSLVDIVSEQREARKFALQMQIFVYGFLIIIGLIGSLNIINTVQTNLLLRRREIGLLQAVGMTMGQIRRMASAEGVWYGVIGNFWGLLLGGGFSYFLYIQLNDIQGIPFAFPWVGALIACGFALGVGLLSVQGPLRRMGKANLIEELREEV